MDPIHVLTIHHKSFCTLNSVEFEEHIVRNLAKSSNGDLRSAINDLEVIARGKDRITSEDLELLSRQAKMFQPIKLVRKKISKDKISTEEGN